MRVDMKKNGTCCVKYVSTHVGHKSELCHLQLTKRERESIAADIASGIPFSVILDKIRDTVVDSNLERIHLITRQDLHNIDQSYNLSFKSIRHHNDAISVEAWVNEVNGGDSPCVLFYKPQDVVLDSYPQLKRSDFALIIMNNAQGEILKKYGNDCVCVDGTHGLNGYNFELITLLVLDDLRQGFPCAFLISDRNDSQMLSIFFQHIKRQVGSISPNVFMSDLAESFFIAWNDVMAAPSMRLYCTWHVDRCWRKNIKCKIQGVEKQGEVYKQIRTLMHEQDVDSFDEMLNIVLERLECDPDTVQFATYFRDNYVGNANSWAYCHRLNAGINTNMHIERMHRTIKYIYLGSKCVKRLDKAIFALMSFVKHTLE
ncbi:uncharacterized protein LOC124616568 [Schistocerca americana]|uniref:uncharacterized protein LOC124616568 n=1 Tax=Schistocerca americana TaxID=7009 RepID=UPI001F4FC7CC|nr:uncharacterized protein LOC124616568 [Schistocerca americana]